MAQCEGGATDTGDERRVPNTEKVFCCRRCNAPVGETYRAIIAGSSSHGLTHLRLNFAPVIFVGDGRFACPNCGEWMEWSAGREAMEQLLARRRQYGRPTG